MMSITQLPYSGPDDRIVKNMGAAPLYQNYSANIHQWITKLPHHENTERAQRRIRPSEESRMARPT